MLPSFNVLPGMPECCHRKASEHALTLEILLDYPIADTGWNSARRYNQWDWRSRLRCLPQAPMI